MKFLCATLSVIGALFVTGCDENVPSNYDLAFSKTVSLYDSSYTEAEFVGILDISPIAEILASADWTSKTFIRKGSWRLRTAEGRDILLSYYGSFFEVVGVSGSFLIRAEHKEAYDRFTRKLSEETVIPWRIAQRQKEA